MKTIIISCNYYEGKTGNLEQTLKCLQKVKLDNTYIAFIDNNSKDNSIEILKKYKDLNVIDYAIVTDKNVGKAKALNFLLKKVEENIQIDDNDIILHLDSDIRLIENNFIKHLQEICVFFNNKYSFYAFTDHEIETKSNTYFNIDIREFPHYDYKNDKIYVINTPSGIVGCCLAIPYKYQKMIGGYNECLGKSNTPAIYGGDDAKIIYDLMCKSKLPCFISSYLKIFHPETLDKEYKNFKEECIKEMLCHGYGSKKLTTIKGFYD